MPDMHAVNDVHGQLMRRMPFTASSACPAPMPVSPMSEKGLRSDRESSLLYDALSLLLLEQPP